MTTRSSQDPSVADNPALATIAAWININRPMMAAMTELNGRLIEQVSKANNEWLGFLNRRFTDDLQSSQRLMECKTIQELFAAYSELVQRAQAQYQSEFQYFARLNQKFADETASVVRSRLEDMNGEVAH